MNAARLCLLVLVASMCVATAVAIARADEPAGGARAHDDARFEKLRQAMVDEQIRARGIRDARVLAAMERALRHHLVPDKDRDEAYQDHPVPIGCGQTISQPYIVALMSEHLTLDKNARVLEIGTGSGYQAAVLAEMGAEVYSIEIFGELHERAAVHLKELGYEAVQLRHGDGTLGWPEKAPFDAIIVTCAASHIPAALIAQLKPGGRMCIPVGPPFGAQRLLVVEKAADGKTSTRTITGVRFVPLLTPEEAEKKEKQAPKDGATDKSDEVDEAKPR